MPTKKTAKKTLRAKLVKSVIGCPEDQKRTVKALGLKRINDTSELVDNDAVQGMLFKVKHLITVEKI